MKPIHDQRLIKISVRFTEKEHGLLLEEADISGLSLSAYIRQRSMGRRVSSKADLRALAELRRIGGLLKHIHNETKGAYSAKTAEAIREITRYARLLNEELANRRNRS